MDPTVYSGDYDQAGSANENAIHDVAMFIYKLDGTPEAMGYMTLTDFAAYQKITVKCYSGTKLIYVAANLGGDKLIAHGQGTTSNTASPDYLGVDWTDPVSIATSKPFSEINAPLWSTGASTFQIQTTTSYTPTSTTADGLIKALSGDGTPSNGVLNGIYGSGSGYFMSNWGDKDYQTSDFSSITGSTYLSTCIFTIRPSTTAEESRNATPDMSNYNGKNALWINVQRALAQIAMETIPIAVLNNAGTQPSNFGGDTLDNRGVFVPEQKWAVGNINTSTYPFQQFDGMKLKGTLYDSIGAIPFAYAESSNPNWSKQMDNSRWIPTFKTYEQQDLSVNEVLAQLNSCSSNQTFGINNRVLVTENNNKYTLNAYTTFVLYAGRYKPNKYVINVDNVGNITYATGNPAPDPVWSPADGRDTMYYIQSTDTTGIFIWGKDNLKRYIGWCVLHTSPNYDPATTPSSHSEISEYYSIIDCILNFKSTTGNIPPKLQEYWHGYCFYRGFVRDVSAELGPNICSVRRNHIYQISVTSLKGPGIANPNDIIDPHFYDIEPIEEFETYSTVSINVMHWHIINQQMQNGVN
jgi:hypothetical protein